MKRWQLPLLLAVIGVLVLIWFHYRPLFYANVDEHNYLRTAWKMSHFQGLTDLDPSTALGGFKTSNGYVSKYNIGHSIWLSLGQFVLSADIPAQLTLGLGSYLLILAASYWLLRQLKLPKISLLAIALFPPLVYFSRTAFSENTAAFLFTASCALLLYLENASAKRLNLASFGLGLSLGALVLTRYNFAIWAVLVVGFLAWQARKTPVFRKSLALVAAGALLPAVVFSAVNLNLYTCLTCSGYKFSGEEVINLNLFARRFPEYLLKLNLLYPALFMIPLLYRHYLARLVLVFTIVLVLFYSVAGGFLYQESLLVDVTAGNRFFLPLMPVLIIFSLKVAQHLWQQLTPKLRLSKLQRQLAVVSAVLAFALVGLIGAVLVSRSHQAFITERAQKAQAIATFVGSTPGRSKLFLGDEEDFMYFGEHLGQDLEKVGYLNTADYEANPDLRLRYSNSDVYLLQVSYKSRADRPTANNNRFLQANADKLQLVYTNYEVAIYKLNQQL